MRTRWSRPAVFAFEATFRPWLHRRIDGPYLAGLEHAAALDGRAVLLVANHTSWWDPFLIREAHRRLVPPGVPMLTLMRRDELDRRPFFRLMGVTGLDATPAGIREALGTLRRFRAAGPAWALLFPQGRLTPSWQRPLVFRRGLAHLARALAPAAIIPVAVHVEAGRKPSPAAYVWLDAPLPYDDAPPDPDLVAARLTARLDALLAHVGRYGEDAPAHWPPEPAPTPDTPFLLHTA